MMSEITILTIIDICLVTCLILLNKTIKNLEEDLKNCKDELFTTYEIINKGRYLWIKPNKED